MQFWFKERYTWSKKFEISIQSRKKQLVNSTLLQIFSLYKALTMVLKKRRFSHFTFLFFYFLSSFYIFSFGFKKGLVNNFQKVTACFIFPFYPEDCYLQSHLAFASSSAAKVIVHSLNSHDSYRKPSCTWRYTYWVGTKTVPVPDSRCLAGTSNLSFREDAKASGKMRTTLWLLKKLNKNCCPFSEVPDRKNPDQPKLQSFRNAYF